MTSGAVGTCRFENVCVPEQPLKLYPTEIVVSISSEDTVNVMALPCAVVPFSTGYAGVLEQLLPSVATPR